MGSRILPEFVKGALHRPVNLDVPNLRMRLVDAEGEVLGRLASKLSAVLQGKDKPMYRPEKDGGDIVVVVNAEKVELTGKKMKQMEYKWHTGYPGGLKSRTVEEQLKRKPTEVLRLAVKRMLPRNGLHKTRMNKLLLYEGPEHPFPQESLTKWEMPPAAPKKQQDEGPGLRAEDIPEGWVPLLPWEVPGYKIPDHLNWYKVHGVPVPDDEHDCYK